jgi:hypothetical protein
MKFIDRKDKHISNSFHNEANEPHREERDIRKMRKMWKRKRNKYHRTLAKSSLDKYMDEETTTE